MDGINTNNEIDLMRQRLEIAKQITNLYSLERYVYVAFCGVSILLLLYAAWRLMNPALNPNPNSNAIPIDYTVITTILGSGGMFATSLGLLMFQWNKIVNLILARDSDREEPNNAN